MILDNPILDIEMLPIIGDDELDAETPIFTASKSMQKTLLEHQAQGDAKPSSATAAALAAAVSKWLFQFFHRYSN